MSGSYDDNGIPLPPTGRDALGYGRRDYEAVPATVPPTARTEAPAAYEPLPPPRQNMDLGTPAERDGGRPPSHAIVPAGSVAGRSLTLVISIMCFFACLTAGAVYLMNTSASAWMKNLASEITVQVEPRGKPEESDARLRDILAFLNTQPGVIEASPISIETSRALLEPWLGTTDALETLPIPRLIAIEIDPGGTADLDQIRASLTSNFPGTTLDDHRQWQQQIRTVTRSFALGGLAILLLVGAATTAIIVSATRSAMLSNREIVEVLHLVGATDRFIAREFERNFLAIGIRAGLVGAACAAVVFLVMPTVMEVIGGGTMTLAEIKRLVGTGSLDAAGFLLLGIVVVVVAALCMLTSRFGVYRILNSR